MPSCLSVCVGVQGSFLRKASFPSMQNSNSLILGAYLMESVCSGCIEFLYNVCTVEAGLILHFRAIIWPFDLG